MAIKTLPSRELLRQLLRYDVTTGQFTWLPRPREMFRNEQNFRLWNTRYAGKIAGSNKGDKPYLYVAVHHRQYLAHRLVWLYIHGEPVPDCIDHIDGTPANNRFTNLRAATKAQNSANMRLRDENKSGVKGVGLWHGYYRARIMLAGKDITIGYFKTLEEAAKARFEAASRLHGVFARHD